MLSADCQIRRPPPDLTIRREQIGINSNVWIRFDKVQYHKLLYYKMIQERFLSGYSVSRAKPDTGLPKRPGYAIVWTHRGSLAQR